MPEPREGMTKEEWMSMCMGSEESRKSFPKQDQRAAVCLSKWRRHMMKKSKSEVKEEKTDANGG
jgi:hypothetical protein